MLGPARTTSLLSIGGGSVQSHGKFVEAVWHISSVGRVCVAVDSLQPAILLNPLLRPLEHPRADTGEEGGREGVPFHQGWRRAEHTMALVLGEWEKVSITAMGTACHPVRHKHPAHGCPHSYPRVLPGHQSTQPASRVAARTAGLPALVQDGAGDRGASPWDHAVHFGRTCWLGEAHVAAQAAMCCLPCRGLATGHSAGWAGVESWAHHGSHCCILLVLQLIAVSKTGFVFIRRFFFGT